MNGRPHPLAAALHEALDRAEQALTERDEQIRRLALRLERLERLLAEHMSRSEANASSATKTKDENRHA